VFRTPYRPQIFVVYLFFIYVMVTLLVYQNNVKITKNRWSGEKHQ